MLVVRFEIPLQIKVAQDCLA